jgi:hypothetical protein
MVPMGFVSATRDPSVFLAVHHGACQRATRSRARVRGQLAIEQRGWVVLAVGLLVAAVAGVILHPRRLPASIAPLLAAGAVIAFGVTTVGDAVDAVRPLVAPLLFLLVAVPLAVLLDRLGFGRRPPHWSSADQVTALLGPLIS